MRGIFVVADGAGYGYGDGYGAGDGYGGIY